MILQFTTLIYMFATDFMCRNLFIGSSELLRVNLT